MRGLANRGEQISNTTEFRASYLVIDAIRDVWYGYFTRQAKFKQVLDQPFKNWEFAVKTLPMQQATTETRMLQAERNKSKEGSRGRSSSSRFTGRASSRPETEGAAGNR